MLRTLRITAVIALVMGVLTGCAGLNSISKVESALSEAGYRTTSAGQKVDNGHYTLELTVDSPDKRATAMKQQEIVQIIWTQYPTRIDTLELTVDSQTRVIQRSEIEQRIGPRDPELDGGVGFLSTLMFVVGGLLLLCVIALVLIVWLVRRRRAHPVAPGHPQPPA
ncbi:hypothetical protein D5S17_00115 [Pseudonocardiaceae bacterium YIM PH 21723]|nr:hypothetical protein D5S17_00115 [Pseudonocardiaceae bacterium YIM PH 21723]